LNIGRGAQERGRDASVGRLLGCDAMGHGCDAMGHGCDAMGHGCDAMGHGCDAMGHGCDAMGHGKRRPTGASLRR
jgi:hypothetical protein